MLSSSRQSDDSAHFRRRVVDPVRDRPFECVVSPRVASSLRARKSIIHDHPTNLLKNCERLKYEIQGEIDAVQLPCLASCVVLIAITHHDGRPFGRVSDYLRIFRVFVHPSPKIFRIPSSIDMVAVYGRLFPRFSIDLYLRKAGGEGSLLFFAGGAKL
ncbi:hypothetical protein DL93DRAFT_291560 [Clavulina sp. PMI_390]|nr:hypothetical protein DL93DRAFT_291560 [Clavulina sp. PMI_390]